MTLRRLDLDEARRLDRGALDATVRAGAERIVDDVRRGGARSVREYAVRFGERGPDEPSVLGHDAMQAALSRIDADDRHVMERAAARISAFATAQIASIRELTVPIPGGEAGHTIEPVEAAGCYAPAGRYPLVSSVLMTALTARAAGCDRVVVASPGAPDVILAAAAIAGADRVLAVGGAHAIAAMAYGMDGLERCDVIAGPGNQWVTAAKQIVSDVVGIDMLAGPSELLVLADETADAALVAADLLAQAEHDVQAVAMLATTSATLADKVDREIERQLATLSTQDVARRALANGYCCVVRAEDELVVAANAIAPEHLEIMTRDPGALAARIRHAGAVFIGSQAAEVLGDYGAGPNHTLPTGGTARFRAGLSVMDFVRLRTWMRIDRSDEALLHDTQRLAALEGLSAHAASAARRLSRPGSSVPS